MSLRAPIAVPVEIRAPARRVFRLAATVGEDGLRLGRGASFEPGMVFTNEPGIYIRPDALDNLPKTAETEKFIAAVRPAFEKYKGIGVRIENNVWLTENGNIDLFEGIPITVEEIEAAMKK